MQVGKIKNVIEVHIKRVEYFIYVSVKKFYYLS